MQLIADDYTDYNPVAVPFSYCNRILIDFLYRTVVIWNHMEINNKELGDANDDYDKYVGSFVFLLLLLFKDFQVFQKH